MSSSIEEEFNPSDDLSREEVIRMARHYINYWKVEANSYEGKYWALMNDVKLMEEQKKQKKKKC